jgi:triphosphoribosyl-dephospho-CoA synthetase
MADWGKASADAMKILGDKAKIPPVPAAVNKACAAFEKATTAFLAARDACADKLLEVENTNDAVGNALKQFSAVIDKEDFNLDAKADAKNIQQAQKILQDSLTESAKKVAKNDKDLDELDKHLIQIGKYKPPEEMSV